MLHLNCTVSAVNYRRPTRQATANRIACIGVSVDNVQCNVKIEQDKCQVNQIGDMKIYSVIIFPAMEISISARYLSIADGICPNPS